MASSAYGGGGIPMSVCPLPRMSPSVSSPVAMLCSHQPHQSSHYLPYCPHASPPSLISPRQRICVCPPTLTVPVSICLSPSPPPPPYSSCLSLSSICPIPPCPSPISMHLSPCPRSVGQSVSPRAFTPVHASVPPTQRRGRCQSIMASSISRKSLCMGTFPPSLMP